MRGLKVWALQGFLWPGGVAANIASLDRLWCGLGYLAGVWALE